MEEFKEYIKKYANQYGTTVGTAIMHKVVLEYGYDKGLTNTQMLWAVKEIEDAEK